MAPPVAPGRIASFTNDELIIGYIFTFIVLFSIDFMHKNLNRPKYFIYFSLIILISFMIGERSNFIKLLILLIFFSMFFLKLNSNKLKLKFIKYTFYSIFVISVFFIALKDTKQARKIYPFFKNIEINNVDIQKLKDKFDKSKHAPHYLAAIDIFYNYPIFGIGINNFYKESSKEIYFNDNLTFGSSRSSTHPHQIYLEILSETGLFGLTYFVLIFLYPIFKIIKIRNCSDKKLIFSHLMLHIFFIFPVLPTGSFFGTIYGIPFWLNLSFLIYFVNESNKIKS
jgi:O-antigen ligase